MSSQYVVFVEGLAGLAEDLRDSTPRIVKAARMAINDTATKMRTLSAEEIRKQVNFPVSYLKPSGKRLFVSAHAGTNSLEAIITGRRRPTSLARFATGGKVGKQGVSVAVKPNKGSKFLKDAFLMKLKSGAGNLDTKSNLGLAMRTKGGKPPNAYLPTKISDNLWLLYGPSVNQVFKTVRNDISDEASAHLEREFLRLLDLDL